jgi:NitT/TauT family transport system permease protein
MKTVAQKLIVPILLLLCWEVGARSINLRLFPSPSSLVSFVTLGLINELLVDYLYSMKRFVVAVITGGILGLLFGVAIGYSLVIRNLLMPTINSLRAIPTVALFPVAMLLFGITETTGTIILAWLTFVPIIVSTSDSIQLAMDKYQEFFQTNDLSFVEKVGKVLIPEAAPTIMTGADLGINLAFKFLILAEIFGIQHGIGYKLSYASDYLNYEKVYIIVISLAICGLLISWSIAKTKSFLFSKILRITA